MQVGGNGTELSGFGQAGEGVFFGDMGQGQGAFDELADAVGGEVAGRGGGGACAEKDAQAEAAGAGLLEGLDRAHADIDAELVAFADYCFGIRGSGFEGQAYDVGGEGFKIECGLVGLGLAGLEGEFGHGSTVTNPPAPPAVGPNARSSLARDWFPLRQK